MCAENGSVDGAQEKDHKTGKKSRETRSEDARSTGGSLRLPLVPRGIDMVVAGLHILKITVSAVRDGKGQRVGLKRRLSY